MKCNKKRQNMSARNNKRNTGLYLFTQYCLIAF